MVWNKSKCTLYILLVFVTVLLPQYMSCSCGHCRVLHHYALRLSLKSNGSWLSPQHTREGSTLLIKFLRGPRQPSTHVFKEYWDDPASSYPWRGSCCVIRPRVPTPLVSCPTCYMLGFLLYKPLHIFLSPPWLSPALQVDLWRTQCSASTSLQVISCRRVEQKSVSWSVPVTL